MINASFVFGLDGDDAGTFRATLDWIVRNKIETVTSHILTPYPGTALYDKLLREGRITDFDLSHYNTAHVVFEPADMTKEELCNGYVRSYKDIYSFRNIIRRLPEAGDQRMACLAFNLFYRKFGRFTGKLCRLLSFYRLGRLAERAAYRLRRGSVPLWPAIYFISGSMDYLPAVWIICRKYGSRPLRCPPCC